MVFFLLDAASTEWRVPIIPGLYRFLAPIRRAVWLFLAILLAVLAFSQMSGEQCLGRAEVNRQP
jgi:hypothetical protein